MKGTRKQKRSMNNLYVPSNTEVPELNLSYIQNRNESVRNKWNNMVIGKSINGSANLTNKQKAARKNVARKMAMGETVTQWEKMAAGILPIPKPKGPKPTKGGKTRRHRK